MEDLDVEFFIDEVRKRPSLWDTSSDEYKNRQLKRDGWKEISEYVFPLFNQKDENEKREIGKAVQLKWKNLRDAYVRHIRQFKGKKSGGSAMPYKTYIYANQLDFLRKVAGYRQTESSLPSTSQESQDDCDTQVDIGSKTQSGPTPSKSTLFRNKKSAVENKLLQYIDSHQQPPIIPNHQKESDDLTFFRSLQTSLDTLSPNDKLHFRIDVMQVLSRYTNKHTNQFVHNFSNFPPHYQPQQYPVMGNFSNQHFNTPVPPTLLHATVSRVTSPLPSTAYVSESHATVLPGVTSQWLNPNESGRVTPPETPFSPTESEDSVVSQADSIISFFQNNN